MTGGYRRFSPCPVSLSQHSRNYALQVIGLGHPKQDGMIRGLHPFLDDLNTAMRVDRRRIQDLQKQLFGNVIRARASDQHATRIQQLQRPQIDLFVPTNR